MFSIKRSNYRHQSGGGGVGLAYLKTTSNLETQYIKNTLTS